MAQSKRTCESAYKDGFMAAWAETDVGEITATLMHVTTLAALTLAQLTS